MAKYVISIVLYAVVLAALILILVFVQVPPYTNMTEAQADTQEYRQLSLEVAACHKAGGEWSTTMTAGGCNVMYSAPDMSWIVDPIPNPAYDTWQIVQPGLILVAIIDGIVLFALLAICIEERRFSRAFSHVEQPGRLFRWRKAGNEEAPGAHCRS
jgi:hypothetical protein